MTSKSLAEVYAMMTPFSKLEKLPGLNSKVIKSSGLGAFQVKRADLYNQGPDVFLDRDIWLETNTAMINNPTNQLNVINDILEEAQFKGVIGQIARIELDRDDVDEMREELMEMKELYEQVKEELQYNS